MAFDFTPLKQALGGVLIAGVCLLTGWRAGNFARHGILISQAARAGRVAAAFVPSELASLSGGDDDLTNPVFQNIKARLIRLQQNVPGTHLLYIIRQHPGSDRPMVVADSVPGPGRLGEQAEDVASTASQAYQSALRSGLPASQPPVATRGSELLFSVAPIIDWNSGTADYFVGLEAEAGDWNTAFWGAFLQWFLYSGVLIGAPFALLVARQRHREQREALRKLSQAMEQSRSAVMIVSLEGRIEYVNAGLCEQSNFSRRELIGKHWRDFVQPDNPPELVAELLATVRAGRTWHGEWHNRRRSGEVYSVRGDVNPVRGRDGRVISYVAVFEDMTEIKRAETTLRTALERAEAGDRAKSHFLATMSHEVRTPLNGIVGFTSLLSEMPLVPEAVEYVQNIRTSAEALIQLTGDILDFAKIETGSIKLETQPTNPRTLIEDALELFAIPAAAKKVELTHWVDEDVPTAILADESRLRQVLTNLVGNAVKFTPAGVVEVTLRLDPAVANGLEFMIRDTGIGIPVDKQSGLFKPFRQVDDTTTRRFGGTGLGLAISRNLARLMGGDIRLESDLGRGCRFFVNIPAEAVSGVPRPNSRIAGMRLLLAAQPGPFREEFERLAERWGAASESVDTIFEVKDSTADFVCVELDEAQARAFASEPAGSLGVPPVRAFAIVPVGLENAVRTDLITHFRQLVNKPLRQDAFAALLAGAASPAPIPRAPPRQFGFNVLVVEDNQVNQRLVQRLLSTLGCAATVAGNGVAGLEQLRGADLPFDLVLMDLHMPELDGLGAIERVRRGLAGSGVQNIWIAVLTADARNEQKEKVYQAGANDYLIKPVSLADLAQSLQRYAEARRLPVIST